MTDAEVKTGVSWLSHHIVSLVVIAVLTMGAVYGIESLIARHDADSAQRYETILATQAQNTKTLQTQLTIDEQNWTQQRQDDLKLIGQLSTAISQRNQQTAAQVKIDTTLSAQDAASRLTTQTKAGDGDIVPQGNTVIVALPVARQIVGDLDQLGAAILNEADLQKQLDTETQIATSALLDVDAQKKLVASLGQQLVDQKKADDAALVAEKAKARKSKIKWFIAGFLVGLGVGHGL